MVNGEGQRRKSGAARSRRSGAAQRRKSGAAQSLRRVQPRRHIPSISLTPKSRRPFRAAFFPLGGLSGAKTISGQVVGRSRSLIRPENLGGSEGRGSHFPGRAGNRQKLPTGMADTQQIDLDFDVAAAL